MKEVYFSKFRLFPEKENGGGGRRRNRIFSFQASPAQRAYASDLRRGLQRRRRRARSCAQYAFMCAIREREREREREGRTRL